MIFLDLHNEEKTKNNKITFSKLFFLFLIIISFNGKNLYSDFVMPISADLNYYNVNVGYEFSGSDLTLFGTKQNLEKIGIVLSGPKRNYLLNKREQVFNLWIKRNTQIFENMPSYYSSWISNDIRNDNELIDFYDLNYNSIFDASESSEFAALFLKDMHDKKKLYYDYEIIGNSDNNLFKVNLFLPNNATIGGYLLNIMSFDKENKSIDGQIIMTFDISHSDFNNFIYRMNKEVPKLYALFLMFVSFLLVIIIRYFMA